MILVEIRIPVLHQTIDFRLREEGKAGNIKRAVLQSLQRLTREETVEEEGFLLLDAGSRKPLPEEWTLKQCGIKNGSSLLLL